MNKERLKTGLEMMGVAADETALDRFEAFHAILDEYNARMDLTAVLDEDERVDRHDLDSAAPLAHGLLAQGAKVIDVGTGAGFPGMPLLILRPDLQITFLDALNKRILFLEDALKRLGLTAATLHARAEDAAKMAVHREQYDAAVSRAVANAATLEELTLDEFKQYSDLFEDDVYTAIDLTTCCEGRTSYGGPSEASVKNQIALAAAQLTAWEEKNA